jgi:hypothetical protein
LYKRIVNADTQSIRIANADGQGVACILTDVKETVVTENFYQAIPVSILKYYMPNGLI